MISKFLPTSNPWFHGSWLLVVISNSRFSNYPGERRTPHRWTFHMIFQSSPQTPLNGSLGSEGPLLPSFSIYQIEKGRPIFLVQLYKLCIIFKSKICLPFHLLIWRRAFWHQECRQQAFPTPNLFPHNQETAWYRQFYVRFVTDPGCFGNVSHFIQFNSVFYMKKCG